MATNPRLLYFNLSQDKTVWVKFRYNGGIAIGRISADGKQVWLTGVGVWVPVNPKDILQIL